MPSNHHPLPLLPSPNQQPLLSLSSYSRHPTTTITALPPSSTAQTYFDEGLRLLFSYFHEQAALHFLSCLRESPDCALAHAFVALCHGPNYNFTGEVYYSIAHSDGGIIGGGGDGDGDDDDDGWRKGMTTPISHRCYCGETSCSFPCRVVARYHATLAMEKVTELQERRVKKVRDDDNDCTTAQTPVGCICSPIETSIITAIHYRFCSSAATSPTLDPSTANETIGRPYASLLRSAYYQQHQNNNNNNNHHNKEEEEEEEEDLELTHLYAESLMVLNAWSLYPSPTTTTTTPSSPDVLELHSILQRALRSPRGRRHAGLCHLYIHLCEMSPEPSQALPACTVLREEYPQAGHLLHMPSHIDVLLGDYVSVVRGNELAIRADDFVRERVFPETSSVTSFYFGYAVHNYHMYVYGAILGGMESSAWGMARRLTDLLPESLFVQHPYVIPYLESYAVMDVHVLVRFGRWEEVLGLGMPQKGEEGVVVMLARVGTLLYARGLAFLNRDRGGEGEEEEEEEEDWKNAQGTVEEFQSFLERNREELGRRYLHNNCVEDLLDVMALTLRGELEFFRVTRKRTGRWGRSLSNSIDDDGGDVNVAFNLLRDAIQAQDSLTFDEPWGVMQSVRHALGGLLLLTASFSSSEEGEKDGGNDGGTMTMVKEAEAVFREDLRRFPKNPWGLVGLLGCLERKRLFLRKKLTKEMEDGDGDDGSGKEEETKSIMTMVEQEHKEVQNALREQRMSEGADFDVKYSCMCVAGANAVVAAAGGGAASDYDGGTKRCCVMETL